jgi:hypothetical protein
MAHFKPPGQCPVCGEWVAKGQAACDECGACDQSGWKNPDAASSHDGLDLPEDEFDYDAFIAREFGGKQGHASGQTHGLWFWVSLVLLVILLLGFAMPLLRA